MSNFLLLLLLIIIILILIPIIRVAWTVHKIRSQARTIFDQMNSASGRSESASGDPFAEFFTDLAREQAQNRQNRDKRKKITSDIGEYVEFQEIETSIEYPDKEIDFTPDEQISDAEWEDLPEK